MAGIRSVYGAMGCGLIDFYVFLTHTERGENVLKKLIVVYIQNDLTLK